MDKGRITIGAGIAGLLISCGTVNVPMSITHPAEINMTPYKQVAIADIDGNLGRAFTDGLKNRMVESAGKFQVVERARLDGIMKELNLSQSDLADETKRAKLGKLLSASAMIQGHIDGKYDEGVSKEKATCGYKENAHPCTAYYRKGVFKTSGSVDVIDVQTGQIVKSKLLNNACEATTSAYDTLPDAVDKDALGSQCLSQNLEVFFKAISPWNEVVQVAFATDKAIPALETGVNQCKIGDFQEAIKTFTEAAQAAEKNPEIKPKSIANAYWNLALAYEYSDQYDQALENLKKAHSFNPSDKYLAERSNVEKRRAEKRKLAEQGI